MASARRAAGVILSSNKFSSDFRRSWLSRTRPRQRRKGLGEGLVALLCGRAVLVSGAGGDLLPGGAAAAGSPFP